MTELAWGVTQRHSGISGEHKDPVVVLITIRVHAVLFTLFNRLTLVTLARLTHLEEAQVLLLLDSGEPILLLKGPPRDPCPRA